ncbi:hypothetical protein [Cellulosimicrobium protaetiae]
MLRAAWKAVAGAATLALLVSVVGPGAHAADDGAGRLTVVIDQDCSLVAPDDCPRSEPRVVVQDAHGVVKSDWLSSTPLELSSSLAPGSYFLTIRDARDHATIADRLPVAVTAEAQQITVPYQPRPSAWVTLHATDTDGSVWGLGDAELWAPDGVEYAARYLGWSSGQDYRFRTRAFGQWRLVVRAGEGRQAFVPTYYPGVADAAAAELVDIVPGADISLAMGLLPGGRISGELRGPTADPQVGRGVRLYTTAGVPAYDVPAWFTGTGNAYVITSRSGDRQGIAPGEYLVKFDGGDEFASEFYDGGGGSFSIAKAKPVVLTGGETVTGVDVDLTPCGSISGQVTGLAEWPQMRAGAVYATNVDDPDATRLAWKDADDRFTITGLAPGTYTVSVAGRSHDPRVSATYFFGGDTTSGTQVTIADCDTAVVGADIAFVMKPLVPPSLSMPTVGTKLTATPGSWNVTNASYTFAWLRDGALVPGATSSTYTPVAADAGHLLSVVVTARHVNYRDATATSATARVAPGAAPRVTKAPVISGTVRIGSTLRASAGAWSVAGVTPSYQWYRAGKVIPRATSSSYTVTTSDAGSRLSVRVTVKKAGYTSASAVSGSTVAVPKVKPTLVAAPVATTISRTTAPKVNVRVQAAGVPAPVGTLVVTLGTKTTRVVLTASSKGKTTVTLPRMPGGKTYPLRVSFSPSSAASSYLTSSSVTAPSVRVR